MRLRDQLRRLRQAASGLGRSNRQIFDDVYRNAVWGNDARSPDGISSGAGSGLENAVPYAALVADFVAKNDVGCIVDVGCGDFRVGSSILERCDASVSYLGVDVSGFVIERNRERYASERVSFVQADAAREPLPEGDLVLVREVLQHLSNRDIRAVVRKVRRYRFNIVTNTVARGDVPKNVPLASGPYSRAGVGSGLWLDEPPFNLTVTELCRWPHRSRPSELVAVQIEA